MAEITSRAELTTVASGDKFFVRDVSDTTDGADGTDKWISRDNLPDWIAHSDIPDWNNVKDYGATGDGETDDTSAIASAIAGLPATGGVLYFPPGTYVTSGGFTLSNPVLVMGAGAGDMLGGHAVTQINCTSATAVLFTLSNNRRATFRDIAFKNTASTQPTAGAAVQTIGTYVRQRVDYDSVSAYGFYINFDLQVGANWTMHNTFVLSPVLYGVKIRNTVNVDSGDWKIDNCDILPGLYYPTAAIHIESSGGGKITNTKINRTPPTYVSAKSFAHGISMDIAAGNTSILLMTNNSIENVGQNGINLVTSGGGWSAIHVINNQFGLYNSPGSAVYVNAQSSGKIAELIVMGNTMRRGGTTAIDLTNVSNGVIGANIITDATTDVSLTTCTDIVQLAVA